MRTKRLPLATLLSAAAMAILILDSKIALEGAVQGIDLCIRTVIPSLFPFFVISTMLTSSLSGHKIPFASPLERLLRIPQGAISLFLIGILGGYPVGAKTIAQAHRSAVLDKSDAQRMVVFCNNAGPSFLFGMCGGLFSKFLIPWTLWCIQILSALLVGICLPGAQEKKTTIRQESVTITEAVNTSVKVMAQVCGWVVLFRVLILFVQRWFLFFLPEYVQILITGFLELTNGCDALRSLPSESLRFVLCGLFLSFGGVCVGMQTLAVTQPLDIRSYFPGKCLQAMLSLLLCILLQPILFPNERDPISQPLAIASILLLTAIFFLFSRKTQNKSSIFRTAHV